jgi:trehalose 6-phosphate synthase
LARLVIVSNRVSLPSERAARAGGLAVGMREALRRYGGVWFGWSGEIAEAPSETPQLQNVGKVTYATVDLSRQDFDEYYNGYANSTLWPLLHYRSGLIEFHRTEFEGYLRVNQRMARALAPLLKPDDIVWVHDYHLIPLGAELRALGVTNKIGFFLHVPFPATEMLVALPRHAQLVEALCRYDLVGFQTENDLRAFRDYIVVEAHGQLLSGFALTAFGHELRAGFFPIGIDTDEFASIATATENSPDAQRLKESLVGRNLIIGVDRLDYSKGLVKRCEAFETLLATKPEHRSRVTFMQIAPPSRSDVAQYKALRRELERAAGRINGKYAEFDWMPIRYLNRSFNRTTLAGFYRHARIGFVTPLRDGMNLVAKEYVAAQDPKDPGVLVLSRFAGAARELTSALIVNPLDTDHVAQALDRALTMSLEERQARWQKMMAVIRANTITVWRERFLSTLQACPRQLGLPSFRNSAGDAA